MMLSSAFSDLSFGIWLPSGYLLLPISSELQGDLVADFSTDSSTDLITIALSTGALTAFSIYLAAWAASNASLHFWIIFVLFEALMLFQIIVPM